MSFLTLEAVSKRYGAVTALDRVSLRVEAGGRAVIVGPSGSGKTTLLRLIAGFDVPDDGRITLDGRVLAEGPTAVPAHRRDVGVVMQDGALFPHLSVAENIGFGLSRRAENRTTVIAELSDMVGLDRVMLARKPDALSGGQQQRVALARALAVRPKLMLLDEPFSALDTGLRAATRQAIAGLLQSRGVTTVLVTHDQAEALSFADRIAIMDRGRILQAGAPRELYFRPRTAIVARFFGDAIILPATLTGGWAHCALGQIETDNPNTSGNAEIMLRPEQISLTDNASGPVAHVADVAFAGASCLITLRIDGSDNSRMTLSQSSFSKIAPGLKVGVVITGRAHVLADSDPGGGVHVSPGDFDSAEPFDCAPMHGGVLDERSP